MAAAPLAPSDVSARAEEMVRMAHSGHLPPSLAAFKQQLLDECQSVAASGASTGGDHELKMVLTGDDVNGLSLHRPSVVPSAGSKESYQLPPWEREWDIVRRWEWGDVLVGGAKEEKVTSVCLLLALLPSLHPRLTHLRIYRLYKLKLMRGAPGKWVAQAVEVLCAAMLSLCRQSANMITHLHLDAGPGVFRTGGDDFMERGSVHLSHLLRSTHCNLLSLSLAAFKQPAGGAGLIQLSRGPESFHFITVRGHVVDMSSRVEKLKRHICSTTIQPSCCV